MSNWKSKFLSFGGRLILLKSVLSSLPVYFLSFFKVPTGIISSNESLFNFFFLGGWWGCQENCWVGRDTVCLSKEEGGLGVRRLKEFNVALLGKWCWRMLWIRRGYGIESYRRDTVKREGGWRMGGNQFGVVEDVVWYSLWCGVWSGVGLRIMSVGWLVAVLTLTFG